MTTLEIIKAIRAGVPARQVIPEGADPAFWNQMAENYTPSKPKKRRTPARRRQRRSHSQRNYAAAVVGRSMATLVSRVNEKCNHNKTRDNWCLDCGERVKK